MGPIFNMAIEIRAEEESNSQAMLEFCKAPVWKIDGLLSSAPFDSHHLFKRCVKFIMACIIMLETHVTRRSALAHRLRNILYTRYSTNADPKELERNGPLYKQWAKRFRN